MEHDGGVRGDFLKGSSHGSVYQKLDAHVVASTLATAALLALGAVAVNRASGDRALGVALGAGAAAFTGKALLAALYEG